MELKLTKPIQAHGKTVDLLNFRDEMTGADIRRCGDITKQLDGGKATAMNTEAIAAYISTLANVPPSSVDQMSMQDFGRAAVIVAGFFMISETSKTSSTDAGNLQESSQA